MQDRAWWFMVLLLAAALLIMPACDSGGGGGGATKTVVGVWTVVDSNIPTNIGKIIVFEANGTGTWGGIPLTYSYSGSTITLVAGNVFNYTLAWLTDNKIQITDTNSGNWIIMVR